MSLVGKVGRKKPRARLAMLFLYLLLSFGAVTTLYPFALMASTGLKGPTDQDDNSLVPSFWKNEEDLYQKYLSDKYSGSLTDIEATRIDGDAKQVETYERFLKQLPLDYWHAGFRTGPNQVTSKLTMRYQRWLRNRYPTIDKLNKAYIEENAAFQTIAPPVEMLDRKGWAPAMNRKYSEWLEFKKTLPAEFRIPVRAQKLYPQFLKARFGDQMPPSLALYKNLNEIPLPARSEPLWTKFAGSTLPTRYTQKTTEELWHEFSGKTSPLPIASAERQIVKTHASELKKEFSGRNFSYVLDYILINGRAVFNTVMFCLLAILTQLIVNPLAAYALSRYPIPASGKILLFLLATMAFPAEVTMIPSFLLLKDLGLLNTFAALVLPTAASGYMIFILKGFFDSLPQEIFEAGQLDGAHEATLMTRVAFPLSKPVLGYLSLLAFLGAYGAFMYAFLVAQDQKMWTLMVWIYQLQSSAPKAVMMAALTLAALPTLLVFLFAQRVIMRGIVLPGER